MKISVFLVIMICFIACKKKDSTILKFHNTSGKALGTSYSILYYSNKNIPLKSLDSIFKVVNQSMSTYLVSSDISKINAGDTTVVVDKMFKEVFLLSKEINIITGGYFDPTVGTLVNAWGFGPKKLKLAMNKNTVDSLLQYVGLEKLKLTANSILEKQHANITLDFNAIAKGYCIDRIAAYFDTQNIDNYLIELGGELVAKGGKVAEDKPWTVGIDDPNQTDTRTLISTLGLKDRAMATSGNYRKFRVDSTTGERFVHTINPITGFTEISSILSVSVLANDCATADAFATAFMAMPFEKTKDIVAGRNDIEVYVLYSVSKDSIGKYISEGFKEVLNKNY